MAQNQTQKMDISEALRRAEEGQHVFFGLFTKEEIERTGFDTSPFEDFKVVEVYLMFDGDQFVLKYIFDGDLRFPYYKKESEIGGRDSLIEAVREMIEIAPVY
jgi:hypothetical protein